MNIYIDIYMDFQHDSWPSLGKFQAMTDQIRLLLPINTAGTTSSPDCIPCPAGSYSNATGVNEID